MFTVNAELHPKTFFNGNLMDVFELNESCFSFSQFTLQRRSFGKSLWKAHHCSLAKSHHAVLGSTCVCRASPLTGAGCLLGWCCTILAILAACSFPAIQECTVAFFFFLDERSFGPGTHQRLHCEFRRKKQVWGPSPSLCGLCGPKIGVRWEGLCCWRVPSRGMSTAGSPGASSISEQKTLTWSWKAWDLTSTPAPDQLNILKQDVSLPHNSVFRLKNPSAWVLHSLVGVKNCLEGICDFRAGRQPALPWVSTPWGSKLAQDCRYWWAIISGGL